MRLAALMLAAALVFPAVAATNHNTSSEVPGTEYRLHLPDLPPPDHDVAPPVWDDTADTYDELNFELEQEQKEEEPEIQPEVDLRNDVDDALFEAPLYQPENEGPGPILPGDPSRKG